MRNLAAQGAWVAWGVLHPRNFVPTIEIGDFSELMVPEGMRLVVLDKDNCFARPHETTVEPRLVDKFNSLKKAKEFDVVVLSNTAGDKQGDPDGRLARELESNLGVPVLRHCERKPMCYAEICRGRWSHVKPHEVLIVGDRLATDILMANVLGAKSAWIRPGLHPSWLNWAEMRLYGRSNGPH